MTIAFLYEHPSWSRVLLAALDARGVDLLEINVAELAFEADARDIPFGAAVNRINVMPSAETDPRVVFQTLHYLHWLESAGVRVINGARAHGIGCSKAWQNAILATLNMHHPRAVAIYRVEDAIAAAKSIGFPVIVKPNIGGSGSGIAKFDDQASLNDAVNNRTLELGIDGTGLIQEFIEGDGFVYRVEILGESLFYAIKQPISRESFNYCAADGCTVAAEPEFDLCVVDANDRIQRFDVSEAIVRDVASIVRACDADLGGVEYLVDPTTGQPCYYDFNPYSNFVSNGEALFGFSPEQRYIDFVIDALDDASHG